MPEFYTLPFLKMEGLGNDLIFLNGEKILLSEARPMLSQWLSIVGELTRRLCNRRLAIGGDGLILAMSLDNDEMRQMAVNFYGNYAKDCHLSWTYHNSDGSQSHMCGNGLRCLALWAKLEKNLTGPLRVATHDGPVTIDLIDEDHVTVIFNSPRLSGKQIPFEAPGLEGKQIVRQPFAINGMQFPITCVNVGNPHCVIFEGSFLKPDLFRAFEKELPVTTGNVETGQKFFPQEIASLARSIELDARFPECTNVEFVKVLDRGHIQLFVWERGSGPTLACGSAAMAAVIAGVLEERLDRKVAVTLPGGTLLIEWLPDDNIKMTGAANLSFRGQIKIQSAQLKADSTDKSKMVKTKAKLSKAGAI